MTQQHILILTLGPVQSFIAEARRTADLYAGSSILVELTRAIVQTINRNGGELIYPASDDLETAGMPNKLVAIVNNPQQVADEAHDAMLEKWREFAARAFKEINVKLNLTLNSQRGIEVSDTDPELAQIIQRQLNHHLEFYWAAAPYDGTDVDYENAYQKADRALGSRKQTRNFVQAVEGGFKDSLSGTRSALQRGHDKDAREYWADIREKRPPLVRQLQQNELLDTLGAIKRFTSFAEDDRDSGLFPSTSTVASTSYAQINHKAYIQRLSEAIQICNAQLKQGGLIFEKEMQAQVDEINEQSKSGYFYKIKNWRGDFEYDGDLFYLETYSPQNLATRYNFSEKDYRQAQPVLQQINEVLQSLYKDVGKRPSPYYAILQMDGDLMGKHVSHFKGKEEHKQLSQDLDKFTKQATTLVKKHHGYLIYTGGDDVLAMFPADTALTAANELAAAYQQQFTNRLQVDDNNKFPFTASVGIAFAHHLYPLDGVLDAAHQAEKRAKNHYQRNALSVTVLRRSGETLEVGGNWQAENSVINTVSLVNQLKGLLETDQISSRFPYSIMRDIEVVTKLNPEGQKAILKQVLNRHADGVKQNKPMSYPVNSDGETEAEIIYPDDLLEQWLTWTNAHNNKDENNQGYTELARWFALARWLAAGGQE